MNTTNKQKKAATPSLRGRRVALAPNGAEPEGPSPVGNETARVRLESEKLRPPALQSFVGRVYLGMKNSPIYGTPTSGAQSQLLISSTALTDQINSVESLETQLRSARLALAGTVENARQNLATAAAACESTDSTAAALSSAGWQLRRPPGPAQPTPPPVRGKLIVESLSTAPSRSGSQRSTSNPSTLKSETDSDPAGP